MKKKFLIGSIGVLVLLIVILGIYFVSLPNRKNNPLNLSKVVDVDQVVQHPDRFHGFVGVDGIVIKVDPSKDAFVLGCEDLCIMMPVKYTGQMPDVGCQITVYGEIKQSEDEKFVFEAQEIKTK